MKPNIHQLVSIVSKTITTQAPVVEIGSFQVKGQEHYANLRPLFSGKEYIGCDMRKGKGVNRIENVEKLTFKDNSIPTLLCLETLEHVWDIQKAASELVRVLKSGGALIVSTVFAHPIHDHPSDYWRFTPESLNQLFKQLSPRLVGWQGISDDPHTVFCIGIKKGSKGQEGKLLEVASQYKQYLHDLKPEPLRLRLRKWRHEPMEQIRKLVAEKEEFGHTIHLNT